VSSIIRLKSRHLSECFPDRDGFSDTVFLPASFLGLVAYKDSFTSFTPDVVRHTG
jgi:hypothetical protein